MSFGRVESGPNIVSLGPGVKETNLCDEPVQYAFYKNGQLAAGECFDPNARKEGACPSGYEWAGTTPEGCERTLLGDVGGFLTGTAQPVRVICKKTSFKQGTPAGKLQCCLRQNASRTTGTECPPGFCRQKINDRAEDLAGVDEGCYDVFVKHCMGEYRRADGSIAYDGWRMFTDDDCKAYVNREEVRNGPNKRRIADLMTQMCKAGGRFAASQPLCQCVLSTEPEYCLQSDCFARQNRALAGLAPCTETDVCNNPEAYKPPEPEGGCPKNICAPLLELKCVNLQSEQAIKILVDCSLTGNMTDAQLREAAQRLGVSVEDVKRAAERRAAGEAVAAEGTEGKNNGEQQQNGGGTAEEQTNDGKNGGLGLSTEAYIGIAVAALFLIILVAVLASRSKRVRSAWQQRPSWMMMQQSPAPYAPPMQSTM